MHGRSTWFIADIIVCSLLWSQCHEVCLEVLIVSQLNDKHQLNILQMKLNQNASEPLSHTGCPSATIPYNWITFGCLNCAMMAASCRNLTLSSWWDVVGSSILMATSRSHFGVLHFPMWTPPNWPCPQDNCVLNDAIVNKY